MTFVRLACNQHYVITTMLKQKVPLHSSLLLQRFIVHKYLGSISLHFVNPLHAIVYEWIMELWSYQILFQGIQLKLRIYAVLCYCITLVIVIEESNAKEKKLQTFEWERISRR